MCHSRGRLRPLQWRGYQRHRRVLTRGRVELWIGGVPQPEALMRAWPVAPAKTFLFNTSLVVGRRTRPVDVV